MLCYFMTSKERKVPLTGSLQLSAEHTKLSKQNEKCVYLIYVSIAPRSLTPVDKDRHSRTSSTGIGCIRHFDFSINFKDLRRRLRCDISTEVAKVSLWVLNNRVEVDDLTKLVSFESMFLHVGLACLQIDSKMTFYVKPQALLDIRPQ